MQIELAAVKTLAKRRRRVTRLFSRSEEPQLQPQCKRNIGIVLASEPRPASISDATIQMDHNAVVLFTIDRDPYR